MDHLETVSPNLLALVDQGQTGTTANLEFGGFEVQQIGVVWETDLAERTSPQLQHPFEAFVSFVGGQELAIVLFKFGLQLGVVSA